MNEAIRVAMISLGCARNLVDSEVLLGHAVEEGFSLVVEPSDADVVIVNTCGFVEEAKEESVETILDACRMKDDGSIKGVVAVGCLAQRYAKELEKDIPELDAVLGITDYSGVPKIIRKIVNGSEQRFVSSVDGGKPKAARSDIGRLLLTPKSYSYLRISEGCNHKCTFCAIPSMRGRNRSKPLDVLVEEASAIAAQGVKELVVVAEDSTAYGLDTHKKRLLHELLGKLGDVEGIEWVRLMYAYPHTVSQELTEVMREHPKVLPYLDIPIQHIASPMLRAMKRGVSSAQVKDILYRLRDEVPGIAVRTTFIVGFPGETDADFEELRDFTAEFAFERMGAFAYSREETTPAHDLENQIEPELALARQAELMAIQKTVIETRNQTLVGQTLPVLVDGRDPGGAELCIGRSIFDAPEVDCSVLLPTSREDGVELRSGDMISCEITGVQGYDLVARPLP